MSEPETVVLTSGALSVRASPDGSLRDISIGIHLGLDEMSFAVRDVEWRTLAATSESFEAHQAPNGFEIEFSVRHRSDTNDILWRGKYSALDGVLVAALRGEAMRDQEVNRAGFSLLHPLELAGTMIEATTRDGDVHTRFGDRIDPRVLLTNLTKMVTHPAHAAELTIWFEGETFETEDHRNWSDAGWKTYCTPLAHPSPRALRRGDVIRQTLTLRAVGKAAGRRAARSVTVDLGGPNGRVVPAIGAGVSDLENLTSSDLHAVRELSLQHLHVELIEGDETEARLRRAVNESRVLALPLRVALITDADTLSPWIEKLAPYEDQLESISVFDRSTNSSSVELLERARLLRNELVPSVAVGGGTRGYFAELNRLPEVVTPSDFVEYSVSAEVHFGDDERVLDTLRGQAFAVRDAQLIAPRMPLHVGPVTLRQRTNVLAFPPPPLGPADEIGPDVDPRQHTAFAGVWALGSVAALIGAQSITLFRSVGARGIIPAGSAGETPLATMVGALAKASGLGVRSLKISDPRRLVGLAIEPREGQVTVWLGNRTAAAQRVILRNGTGSSRHDLAPYSIAKVTFG